MDKNILLDLHKTNTVGVDLDSDKVYFDKKTVFSKAVNENFVRFTLREKLDDEI